MENNKRTNSFKKNLALENIFPEMEKLLGPIEENILDRFNSPKRPVLFIVGCARSGSTLLYQYLSKTGVLAYPTNILSRFYYAPYIGARIQQMLVDFDFKNEIFNKDIQADYNSNLGKTKGPIEPHEFWYFWDRFFKFNNLQQLTEEELSKVDWKLFLKELDSIQYVFKKPLVMKAMKTNWHIKELSKISDQFYFIYIKRPVLYNAQSLLNSRMKFFGNYNEWYSFKTLNYNEITNSPPWEQAIEQVISTNEAIENQLKEIPNRSIQLEYEKFCNNPSELIAELQKKTGIDFSQSLNSNQTFFNKDKISIEESIWLNLEKYYNKRISFTK